MTSVRDANGTWVAVGDRVRIDFQGEGLAAIGTVVQVSDPDGDFRNGRMVGISPTVYVRGSDWDDSFPTSFEPGGDYICHDVVKIGDAE